VRYFELADSLAVPFWQRSDRTGRWPEHPAGAEIADRRFEKQPCNVLQDARRAAEPCCLRPASLEFDCRRASWFEGRRRPWMKTLPYQAAPTLGLLLEPTAQPAAAAGASTPKTGRRLPKGYDEPSLPARWGQWPMSRHCAS